MSTTFLETNGFETNSFNIGKNSSSSAFSYNQRENNIDDNDRTANDGVKVMPFAHDTDTTRTCLENIQSTSCSSSTTLPSSSKNRYCLFPILHAELWKCYKIAQALNWTAEEMDLSYDLVDWNEKLNDNERFFIKNVLAFFASADGVVNENLAERFMNDVEELEAKTFYAHQMYIEGVHNETYSLLIDTFVKDEIEKQKLFQWTNTYPGVGRKIRWAQRWIHDKDASFAERLFAFAIVEGIFFSGSFCAIFWLKKRNLMPGMCTSNEWIARDEALHCTFACNLSKYKKLTLSRAKALEIIVEAVEIEKYFVTQALPVELIGMNAKTMCQYIEYVADYWLVYIGHDKYYHQTNPFDWMQSISLEGKTNMFEKRVTEYSKNTQSRIFDMNADF